MGIRIWDLGCDRWSVQHSSGGREREKREDKEKKKKISEGFATCRDAKCRTQYSLQLPTWSRARYP